MFFSKLSSSSFKDEISSFSTVFFGIWHTFDITSSIIFSSIIFSLESSLFIEIYDPASSIISIALSGKNLSFIYLLLNSTASLIASSVYFTLW